MINKKPAIIVIIFVWLNVNSIFAQKILYPFPLKNITVNVEGQNYKMVYMDVLPEKSNGKSIILFHGKNFNGYYWKKLIPFLSKNGYRVIAPDQIGWGRSTKPNIKYTFQMLAQNNHQLLDSLHIEKVIVFGHSMGGMLATRFALMYPEETMRLILEDPLGLEDYKKFVPYQSMAKLYKKEREATYASYKKYQQSYYPVWKPEYEQYVKAQAEPLKDKDFSSVAWVNALTYMMIYEQPVLQEFKNLTMPVRIIVGGADRTILGKSLLTDNQKKLHGNFPLLAGKAKSVIKDCKVFVLPGVGHIPHIQETTLFNNQLLNFLED